jgi:hypothetical protein
LLLDSAALELYKGIIVLGQLFLELKVGSKMLVIMNESVTLHNFNYTTIMLQSTIVQRAVSAH